MWEKLILDKKYARAAAVISFFLFTGFVLFVAQKIVCAKFIGDSTTIVDGFYAEKKNDIDMIVLGSSNSFCTVNPLVLYEEYGIAAYDFGSSSQPLDISLLYLKEAFKTQRPKLVALEVNMLVGGSINNKNESAFRWGYTDIPLSFDKLKSVYRSTDGINAEYFSYIFPIFRYHERWKELSMADYTYFNSDKTNYTKGYLETQSVADGVNLDDYDFDEGEAWVEADAVFFLDEIVRLCRNKNARLLLFKSPKADWYRYETEAVRAIADERGIEFVDYNEIYQNGGLELDNDADFRDAEHLNDFGAAKVTRHLGAYVKENYEIPDRRGSEVPNSWDAACEYKRRSGWQDFMAATTVQKCFDSIKSDENYVVIVTGAPDVRNVHQWVYRDGEVALDVKWKEDGVKHMRIGKSELVLSKLGSVYQVLLDGINQYQPGKRWNITVYDKITKKVTANLAFDE